MDYLDINTNTHIINDKCCKEYSVKVPINRIDVIKDGYYERPSDIEDDKYYEYIISNISSDEKVMYKHSRIIWGEYALFEVYAKKKMLLSLEKDIWEKLTENGFKVYHVDVDEDLYCRLDLSNRYEEDTLMTVKKLLNAEKFEVCFDGHMETSYLLYKLKESKVNGLES